MTLRIFGGWGLIAAIIALVNDLTHAYQTGTKVVFSTLLREWELISPNTLGALQLAVQRHVAPMAWDPVIVTLLKVPAFAALGLLGVLLFAAGLRRHSLDVYAN